MGARTGSAPMSFVLHQNYPNPFNHHTNIRFVLTRPAHSRLDLFDLGDRRVMTPVAIWLAAGTYEVPVDLSGFASRAYFYRLQSVVSRQTRKLLLIK